MNTAITLNGDPSYVNTAITGSDGCIYIGGYFDGINGDASYNHVAKYDPTTQTWSPVGINPVVSEAFQLCFDPAGRLYVLDNGQTIRKLNESMIWEDISGNASFSDIRIAADGDLLVGGMFSSIGEVTVSNVAKYSPSSSTWSALPAFPDTIVYILSIAVHPLSGDISVLATLPDWQTQKVYKLSSGSWTVQASKSVQPGNISRIVIDEAGDLIIGGDFYATDDVEASCLARLHDGLWSQIGTFDTGTYYSGVTPVLAHGGSTWISGVYNEVCGMGKITNNELVWYSSEQMFYAPDCAPNLGIAFAAPDGRTFTPFIFDPEAGYITNYVGGDTNVVIPSTIDSVAVIGVDGAFASKGLTSVTIPSSVTYIGDYSFDTNQLASVTLPDNLDYIGVQAFQDNLLTSITIPASVTLVNDWAFAFNNITSITMLSAGVTFGSSYGAVFNNNYADFLTKYGAGGAGTYTFADDVWTKTA